MRAGAVLLLLGFVLAGVFVLSRSRVLNDSPSPPETQTNVPPAAPGESKLVSIEQLPQRVAEEPAVTALERTTDPRLIVRVVDEDGTPVANVPVGLTIEGHGVPFEFPWLTAGTGADGRATLDPSESNVSLAKGKPTKFRARIELPLEPVIAQDLGAEIRWNETVELILPRALHGLVQPIEVEVIDAAGSPAPGRQVNLTSHSRQKPSDAQPVDKGETDGEGRVSLSRLQAFADQSRARAMFGSTLDLAVEVPGPFAQRVRADVALDHSGPPIRLQLPPTGTVRVTVTDAAGGPAPEDARVSLHCTSIDGNASRGGSTGWWRDVPDGVMVYEDIGTDLALTVWASVPDGRLASGKAEAPGPAAAGAHVEVTVALGAPVARVAGRLVDETAEPLRGFQFALEYPSRQPPEASSSGDPPRVPSSSHATDQDGRFLVPFIAPPPVAGGRELRIVERSGDPPRFTQTAVPAPGPGETADLGDLVCTDVPDLVSGQVVDAEGEPVRGAWLYVSYKVGEGRGSKWFNVPGPRILSGNDGAFAVHQLVATRELSVSASKPQVGTATARRVPPQTTGVELRLEAEEDRPQKPQGVLAGTLLLDEEVSAGMLRVQARYARGSSDWGYVFTSGFRLDHLRMEPCTVEIQAMNGQWVLWNVDDVEVREGADPAHPKLQDIDLRGQLRFLRLRLVHENGRPAERERVWLASGGRSGSLVTDDDGRLNALWGAGDEEFVVTYQGHGKEAVPWSPDEQTLTFP